MNNLSFKSYLIEKHTLVESFADAQRKFSVLNDPTIVKNTLDKFKQLASANKIKPEYKDITKWMKKSFQDLQHFVDSAEQVPSNKQLKKLSKKDAVQIGAYGDWIVIVPLTEQASCQYGAGTQWCTAAKSNNHFNGYFHINQITLIYFINKRKQVNNKLAVAVYPEKDTQEYFDTDDSRLTKESMLQQVDLTEEAFDAYVNKAKSLDSIKARDNYKSSDKAVNDNANRFVHSAFAQLEDVDYNYKSNSDMDTMATNIENIIDNPKLTSETKNNLKNALDELYNTMKCFAVAKNLMNRIYYDDWEPALLKERIKTFFSHEKLNPAKRLPPEIFNKLKTTLNTMDH